MKNIYKKLAIISITVIYIIAGYVIFSDVKIAQSPKTTVEINVLEINKEEIKIETILTVKNENPFDISTKDLLVISKSEDGFVVNKMELEDKNIPSNKEKSFSKICSLKFKDVLPEKIITEITGLVKTGSIQKSIGIDFKIISSIKNLINFNSPKITTESYLNGINNTHVNLTKIIKIYNPNNFEIYIENISSSIVNENNEKIGNINIISNGKISPFVTEDIVCNANVLLNSLNYEKIYVNVNGNMNIKIANANMSIPLNVNMNITTPDLDNIFLKDIPLSISLICDIYAKNLKIMGNVSLIFTNPTSLEFNFDNIIIETYSVKNDEFTFIKSVDLNSKYTKKENKTIFNTEIELITYNKIINKPDWIVTVLKGDIFIDGINKEIPFEISAYRDLHLFN